MATASDDDKAILEELYTIFNSTGVILMPCRAYDEVFPNIFVGERGTALSVAFLRKIGITHILNMAEGKGFGKVDTSAEYYKREDDDNSALVYRGIKATDVQTFNILPMLEESANFINTAIESGGKILVHCVEGFSRSPTAVAAYLMLHKDYTVQNALRTIRSRREVCPNDGFLKQLIKLQQQINDTK
ncbi:dual specificity protein phosphatase 3-like [Antedon mediterranea]|uniref:dual specificity protein phosphatase 3-like n=1 Tax=Antedon mediterranea TaxID=105859 RepID=UPI003AF98178